MFVLICLLSYFILKLKYMVNSEEWTLVQQNVLASTEELQSPLRLADYSNVTVAL